MWELMHRLARDSKGATTIEYGLIITLVILAMMGALVLFGNKAISMWTNVATTVTGS